MTNPNLAITIGIIGGGQLGKMMAQSAKRQGYRVIILDPQTDCPASQVSDLHLVADYNDENALQQLRDRCTTITYEFENVDCNTIDATLTVDQFPQGTKLLRMTQDRILEKNFLRQHGIDVVNYFPVLTKADLTTAIEQIGFPAILKTARFGYDGKGQIVLRSPSDLTRANQLVASQACILEAWLSFEKEVSIIISRNAKGQTAIFPISENIHQNSILHLSIVPARISTTLTNKIELLASELAATLKLVGTLTIECFVTHDEQLFVNELAPRPHNSGHFSIEATNFSQFDTSIQAVLNLPLPRIQLLSPVVMVNVLGQHVADVFKLKVQKPQWHFHDYGKLVVLPNRKMGHISILTDALLRTIEEIEQTTIWRD